MEPDIAEVKAVISSNMNGAIRIFPTFWVNNRFSLTTEAYFVAFGEIIKS